MFPLLPRPVQLAVKPRLHPALRELVVEASRALTQLDADRLEELALSCQALTREWAQARDRDLGQESSRDPSPMKESERQRLVREARDAQRDMALFARVLDATRANVQVVERLRALRAGRLEYGAPREFGESNATRWKSPINGHERNGRRENRHGND
jgi:hypothetical protein